MAEFAYDLVVSWPWLFLAILDLSSEHLSLFHREFSLGNCFKLGSIVISEAIESRVFARPGRNQNRFWNIIIKMVLYSLLGS